MTDIDNKLSERMSKEKQSKVKQKRMKDLDGERYRWNESEIGREIKTKVGDIKTER